MSDVPVQLIVAAFKDEKTAKEALKALKEAKKAGLIKIENAAVLRKNEKGKLFIKETEDMGGGKVVPAAVGALVGGLTAKLRDTGFSNQRLETLGEGLQPGSSAIVAVVEHTWVDKVEETLAEAEADVMTAEIKADIAAQLEAGHEVAYSVISDQDGLLAGRVAGGEDEVEGGMLAVDDSGMYGGRFFATESGFVVEEMTATDDGVINEITMGVVEEEDKDKE